MILYAPYNYDTNRLSDETGLKCEDVSLAQQHQKDESDINTIVRRFGLTGELPENVRMPIYADYTGITNYHDAMNAVIEADSAFAQMPAEIRSRFDNSAEKFVEFCLDDNNRAEAEKLGLVKPKVVQNEPAAASSGNPEAKPVVT